MKERSFFAKKYLEFKRGNADCSLMEEYGVRPREVEAGTGYKRYVPEKTEPEQSGPPQVETPKECEIDWALYRSTEKPTINRKPYWGRWQGDPSLCAFAEETSTYVGPRPHTHYAERFIKENSREIHNG